MTLPNAAVTGQTWSADTYNDNARFVSDLGGVIMGWLAPENGEDILDLGCGDGALTQELAALGVNVIGVDASVEMLKGAQQFDLNLMQMDGHELSFSDQFDAVFSNAALHWMMQPGKVIAGVSRALRSGGRFVAEMGGFGNVAAIDGALRSAGMSVIGTEIKHSQPNYFPTPQAYGALLEQGGFTVERIELVPRPTQLPTGLEGWITTFRAPFLAQFNDEQSAHVLETVIAALKPSLCDETGVWWADYVRLRFVATKRNAGKVL